MHIAVEATRLAKEKRGIGRYVRNLLRELPRVTPNVRFTLYVRRPADEVTLREQLRDYGEVAANSEIKLIGELPKTTADIAWYPWNQITVKARTAAMAVTIHDLVPHMPFHYRWWKIHRLWKYHRRSRRTVRLAHVILADSEFTASEVVRILKVDRSLIRVVLLAADDFLRALQGATADTSHLRPDERFFLAVGARDERKNLVTLYAAMDAIHKQGVPASLVLCGPGKDDAKLGPFENAPWLKMAGYVSDVELATLYTEAAALVFPSRYEGFGLPVLEAMAAGGCVVCANASSIPEVAGDAALMFDPDDVHALAHNLVRVLREPELRASLVKRGHEQALRFTWGETARQTLVAFESAIAANKVQRR